MKTGIEDRKKLTALVALAALAIVVFVVLRVVSPQPASGSAGTPSQRSTKGADELFDPEVHVGELKQSEETEYTGAGRNIFRLEATAPIPKPIAPARTTAPPAPTAPASATPPPAPPINLKFYGFANAPGEAKRIFLSDGDDVFVGGEGDIVDRHYRILRIGPTSADIEDVQTTNRQTIPLV